MSSQGPSSECWLKGWLAESVVLKAAPQSIQATATAQGLFMRSRRPGQASQGSLGLPALCLASQLAAAPGLHGRACLSLLQRAAAPTPGVTQCLAGRRCYKPFSLPFVQPVLGEVEALSHPAGKCCDPSLWQASTSKWEGLHMPGPSWSCSSVPWSSQRGALPLTWPSVVCKSHSCSSLVGRKSGQ